MSNPMLELTRRPAVKSDFLRASAQVQIEVVIEAQILSIAARKNCAETLSLRIQDAVGIALPAGPRCSTTGAITLLGVGPEVWLAIQEDASARLWLPSDAIFELASVVDLTSAYTSFRLRGTQVQQVLAGGTFIDLDGMHSPADIAIVTNLSHFPAIVWRVQRDPSAFDLLVPRSVAADAWRWLEERAADCGANALRAHQEDA